MSYYYEGMQIEHMLALHPYALYCMCSDRT